MNLDKLVRRGRAPWRPNDEVVDLNIWHVIDVPAAGTFSACGKTVLFTAIADLDERITVWAYAPLSPESVAGIPDIFDSPEDMQAYIEAAFDGREVLIAVADDLLVDGWGRVSGHSLMAAAKLFIQRYVLSLRKGASDELQVDAFRAGAEAYKHSYRDQEPVTDCGSVLVSAG